VKKRGREREKERKDKVWSHSKKGEKRREEMR